MNKTPTAEEFINRGLDDSGFELSGHQLKIIARNVREFAKLHVEARNKSIFDNIGFKQISSKDLNSQPYQPFITDNMGKIWIVDKDSILNAYPLENIK